MKYYKVYVYNHPDIGKKAFKTYINVFASSEIEAESKAIDSFIKSSIQAGNKSPYCDVISVKELSTYDDFLLNKLWDLNRDIYYAVWHPDISDKKIIKTLKEKYPEVYRTISRR